MIARFGKYAASSLLISLLYWALLYSLTEFFKLWYMASTILTSIILTGTGFLINNFWTWRKKGEQIGKVKFAKRGIKYILVGGGTTLLGWWLVFMFTEYAKWWYMISSIVGTIIVMTVAFLLNNYWTWKESEQ